MSSTSKKLRAEKKIETAGIVAIKQNKVLEHMVENGGNLSQAAREVGYSEAYIRSGKLQKTKSWVELIEEALPDEILLSVHQEGLSAAKRERMLIGHANGQAVYEMIEEPDYATRYRYLDMAYKLKRRYTVDIAVEPPVGKFDHLTDEELDAELERLDRECGWVRVSANEHDPH